MNTHNLLDGAGAPGSSSAPASRLDGGSDIIPARRHRQKHGRSCQCGCRRVPAVDAPSSFGFISGDLIYNCSAPSWQAALSIPELAGVAIDTIPISSPLVNHVDGGSSIDIPSTEPRKERRNKGSIAPALPSQRPTHTRACKISIPPPPETVKKSTPVVAARKGPRPEHICAYSLDKGQVGFGLVTSVTPATANSGGFFEVEVFIEVVEEKKPVKRGQKEDVDPAKEEDIPPPLLMWTATVRRLALSKYLYDIYVMTKEKTCEDRHFPVERIYLVQSYQASPHSEPCDLTLEQKHVVWRAHSAPKLGDDHQVEVDEEAEMKSREGKKALKLKQPKKQKEAAAPEGTPGIMVWSSAPVRFVWVRDTFARPERCLYADIDGTFREEAFIWKLKPGLNYERRLVTNTQFRAICNIVYNFFEDKGIDLDGPAPINFEDLEWGDLQGSVDPETGVSDGLRSVLGAEARKSIEFVRRFLSAAREGVARFKFVLTEAVYEEAVEAAVDDAFEQALNDIIKDAIAREWRQRIAGLFMWMFLRRYIWMNTHMYICVRAFAYVLGSVPESPESPAAPPARKPFANVQAVRKSFKSVPYRKTYLRIRYIKPELSTKCLSARPASYATDEAKMPQMSASTRVVRDDAGHRDPFEVAHEPTHASAFQSAAASVTSSNVSRKASKKLFSCTSAQIVQVPRASVGRSLSVSDLQQPEVHQSESSPEFHNGGAGKAERALLDRLSRGSVATEAGYQASPGVHRRGGTRFLAIPTSPPESDRVALKLDRGFPTNGVRSGTGQRADTGGAPCESGGRFGMTSSQGIGPEFAQLGNVGTAGYNGPSSDGTGDGGDMLNLSRQSLGIGSANFVNMSHVPQQAFDQTDYAGLLRHQDIGADFSNLLTALYTRPGNHTPHMQHCVNQVQMYSMQPVWVASHIDMQPSVPYVHTAGDGASSVGDAYNDSFGWSGLSGGLGTNDWSSSVAGLHGFSPMQQLAHPSLRNVDGRMGDEFHASQPPTQHPSYTPMQHPLDTLMPVQDMFPARHGMHVGMGGSRPTPVSNAADAAQQIHAGIHDMSGFGGGSGGVPLMQHSSTYVPPQYIHMPMPGVTAGTGFSLPPGESMNGLDYPGSSAAFPNYSRFDGAAYEQESKRRRLNERPPAYATSQGMGGGHGYPFINPQQSGSVPADVPYEPWFNPDAPAQGADGIYQPLTESIPIAERKRKHEGHDDVAGADDGSLVGRKGYQRTQAP